LQLMLASKQSDNRAAEVSSLSRGVKLLAKELGIPILVLSQFSRSFSQEKDAGKKSDDDKLPKMRHLKESSSIEQDSHVVLLMHRECEVNTPSYQRANARVVVSKQRSGSSGVICELSFNEETQCFTDKA
jgi:replicative DNA helicase